MTSPSSSPEAPIQFRPARVEDAQGIADLIEAFWREQIMLRRTVEEIVEQIPFFVVASRDKSIVGCVALHVYHRDLAEVRSLAVSRELHGSGIGRRLMVEIERKTALLGVTRLCTLTVQPVFFEKLGYRRVEKSTLPEKIWKDCLGCAYVDDCRETALVKTMVASESFS